MKRKTLLLSLLETLFVFGLIFFLIVHIGHAQTLSKYQKWQTNSFFRGFNVLNENPKTLQDIIDLKTTGANFAQLGCFGFREVESPFNIIPANIAEVDSLVSYCRGAGVYYSIAVRQGPGRRDVYLESSGLAPQSTLWNNATEQQNYAGMCREIAQRYTGDTLFAGILLFVEPNPLFNTFWVSTPELLVQGMGLNGIDVPALMKLCIDSVRTIDPELPAIVANVVYSTPEYFSIIQPQLDPYVIYDFHNYVPQQYTKAESANSVSYPGDYFSLTTLSIEQYDRSFLENTTFARVIQFQQQTGSPIIMGEFGMLLPQIGGEQYLADLTDIAVCNGWHFAYWDYRRPGINWDYEEWGSSYWDTVKQSFTKNCLVNTSNTENVKPNHINIYPNPTTDYFIVEMDDNINGSFNSIEIIDLYGQVIVNINMENNLSGKIEVNISSLPQGCYWLGIKNDNSYFMKRIIKL